MQRFNIDHALRDLRKAQEVKARSIEAEHEQRKTEPKSESDTQPAASQPEATDWSKLSPAERRQRLTRRYGIHLP